MDRRLESYIKVYDDWLYKEACDQTITEIDSLTWQQHSFYHAGRDEYVAQSGDQELDVAFDGHTLSTRAYIMQRIWDAFHKYTTDLEFPWFSSWQGYSQVRFNRYQNNQIMAQHCDHIHTLFDGTRRGIPTMTFLAALNDGYAGGEFVMFDDLEIQLSKGSAMVFPSCFLYPHHVRPVTQGVRYSCVSWAF